jgi:hypothetical protein
MDELEVLIALVVGLWRLVRAVFRLLFRLLAFVLLPTRRLPLRAARPPVAPPPKARPAVRQIAASRPRPPIVVVRQIAAPEPTPPVDDDGAEVWRDAVVLNALLSRPRSLR